MMQNRRANNGVKGLVQANPPNFLLRTAPWEGPGFERTRGGPRNGLWR